LWAYHAPASKLVLFDYQPGRGQEGPSKLLADFRGVLQTDGYVVYSSLFDKSERVTLAACMAHVRRKFDEVVYYDAARASYAVTQIARLYAIEQQIRDIPDLNEPAICQKRLLEANPILEQLRTWLDTEYGKVLPSSPIGKAIAYALNLWDRLTVYLYHGSLQIDNNLIENTIRPIALGRKNFLFAGSHAAAQQTAMLYSFLGSCQRNQVQPHQWLSDVLAKLNDFEYEGKFSDLLPNRWGSPTGKIYSN
jgi:transposase